METPDQTCTCVNRKLAQSEAIFWIRPNRTGFVTAKDCPFHGMKDLTESEPVTISVPPTIDPVA